MSGQICIACMCIDWKQQFIAVAGVELNERCLPDDDTLQCGEGAECDTDYLCSTLHFAHDTDNLCSTLHFAHDTDNLCSTLHFAHDLFYQRTTQN
jgi:hypothetical protein